jgi:hypothetical protein
MRVGAKRVLAGKVLPGFGGYGFVCEAGQGVPDPGFPGSCLCGLEFSGVPGLGRGAGLRIFRLHQPVTDSWLKGRIREFNAEESGLDVT